MADHEFLFALEMSDDAESGRMLGQVCAALLAHGGYAAAAAAELTTALSGAVAQGGAQGARRCDVRFVAHDGQLQIVVACAGIAEWRTSRPLPAP